jgi:tRNA pseudouridine38-40 synthase
MLNYLCIKIIRLNRYFIHLAFKGTNYHGWQMQENATTVQEILSGALNMVLRDTIELTGCGRTDTGVHAEEFYAHFDLAKKMTKTFLLQLTRKLNAFLPADISIFSIFQVPVDAHARFSALSRTYEYRISTNKNPFNQEYTYLYPARLDVNLMNLGAQITMGYKDFSCFSKSHTQTKTNNCVITDAKWIENDGTLVLRITADRFLRNMVRAIAGTLVDMGRGKISEDGLRKIIESKKRSNAGKSMPACGLFLTKVVYPENIFTYNQD